MGAYYTLNSTITADYNLSATVSVGTYGHLLGELDGPGSGDHLALCSDVSGKCYLIPVANLVNTTSTIEDEASHIVYDNIGSCSIHDALVSADIDGDGNEDLIAGDSGEDQATVFFGPLSTSPSLYPSTSCNGTIGDCFFTNSPAGEDILIADTSTVGFGSTVVAGALLDSDGPADLIIGALDATVDSVTTAGRYDLLSGASIAALRDSVTATSGITIYADTTTGTYNYADLDVIQYGGDATSARLGLAGNATASGDLNGDGLLDLVLGGSQYAGSDDYGRGLGSGLSN